MTCVQCTHDQVCSGFLVGSKPSHNFCIMYIWSNKLLMFYQSQGFGAQKIQMEALWFLMQLHVFIRAENTGLYMDVQMKPSNWSLELSLILVLISIAAFLSTGWLSDRNAELMWTLLVEPSTRTYNLCIKDKKCLSDLFKHQFLLSLSVSLCLYQYMNFLKEEVPAIDIWEKVSNGQSEWTKKDKLVLQNKQPIRYPFECWLYPNANNFKIQKDGRTS